MLDILAAQVKVVRQQLDALYEQVAVLQVVLDVAMDISQPAPPAACLHLETENVGTFGAPELRCTTCQQVVSSS